MARQSYRRPFADGTREMISFGSTLNSQQPTLNRRAALYELRIKREAKLILKCDSTFQRVTQRMERLG